MKPYFNDIYKLMIILVSKHCFTRERNVLKLLINVDYVLCVDPDILIRTSGEFRISNFLLWQIAYTELFFLDKLWPEVTQGDLQHILAQYAARHRRFGT